MSQELFKAIQQHDTAQVKALLTRGANPNEAQQEWPGLLPLQVAIHALAHGGELAVLLALLEHGADVNAWDSERDRTPLLEAVCENQTAAVELLLKAGAEPNVRSSEGDTPLRACAEVGNVAMATLLLDAGATRTLNDWGGLTGCTALGIAISRLDLPMMRLLLDAGADPEATDDDRQPTRDRLPPRDESDAPIWDAAFKMLGGTKGGPP
ncbi:ankyrin repeat domain-containing protein [Melittangium boletus]|uniref:ankyrin repeat domain-containing protein n=1 Tax=Melittangium boletus TaxID=83453 RepID=UPI003DA20AE8